MDLSTRAWTLGGVKYELVESLTLARAAWMGKWGQRAGLDTLQMLTPPQDAAELDALLAEIVGRTYETGAVIPLLAGGLVVEGLSWSEAQATKQLEHLATVQEAEALEPLALVLWGFIRRVPALSRSMLLSSLPEPIAEAIRSEHAPAPSSPMPTATSGAASPGASPATSGASSSS